MLTNNKAVQMSPLQLHCLNKRMTLPLASSGKEIWWAVLMVEVISGGLEMGGIDLVCTLGLCAMGGYNKKEPHFSVLSQSLAR